jgi:predicted acylesterase/phospholipase RssA
MHRLALPTMLSLLVAGLPAAGMAPPAGPECAGELPFVLNAGVAPSGRFEVSEVEELAGRLFTGVYRAESPCAATRGLQVNLAIGSEYHVLQWLEEGSVDMAIVSDLTLHLLRQAEVELVEVDLQTIDFERLELPADLADQVLPHWRPTLRIRSFGAPGGGSAAAPGAKLRELESWLLSDLVDDPAGLAAVLRDGEERCGEPDGRKDPRVRLTLPSHLSTTGFVGPVAESRRRLDARLDAIGDWGEIEAEELRQAAEGCFWRRYFDRTCFRLEEYRIESPGETGPGEPDSCGARWREEAAQSGALIELRFGREVEPDALGPGDRDHLVVRRSEAEALFGAGTFAAAESELPPEVESLFVRAAEPARPGAPAALLGFFRSIARAEPYLGTRTFAFTTREATELIALHQRFSGRPRLSLVLPGGGVKAAFQSRLLEGLYGDGLLRNVRVEGAGEGPGEAVRVDSVVGTSGGALLGFFVARLGGAGPWGLSEILWQRPGTRNGELVYLNAFDIFGSTDLPRYFSLVAIYLVFAGTLALVSVRHRGWLAPERNGGSGGSFPSLRPALLVLVISVLGLTPLVVRWVNGDASIEHVPEFEGLLYAVLVGLAMFADQALVYTEGVEERAERRRRVWAPPGLLVGAGAVLVAVPLLVRLVLVGAERRVDLISGWRDYLESPISSGEAYLGFAAVAAVLMLSAVGRPRGRASALLDLGIFLAVFVAGTVTALALLRWAPLALLATLDRTPLLFLALGAALLVTAVLRYTAGGGSKLAGGRLSRGYSAIQPWVTKVIAKARNPKLAIALAPLLPCVLILDLTRPAAETFQSAALLELFFEESKLHAPRGGLAVCLGAVLVAIGGVLALHHRRNHYRLEKSREFVDGLLFMVLGLALAVYAVLGAAVALLSWLAAKKWLEGSPLFERAAELSLFELTPAFWLALVVVSLLGSLGLVAWGRAGQRGGGRVAGWVRASLGYLCSRHPNGHVVSRRFVRLGILAVGGLLWWNFILAPALYGNRIALQYLERANGRFDHAYCLAHGGSEAFCEDPDRPLASYRLTTRFLAPANALESDSTRFVLAVPGDEPCPAVPASPGVVWRRFHALHDPKSHPETDRDGCQDLLLTDDAQRQDLMDYIFASGSPFPAFPPRRVLLADATREALVDGGYSNNVPIQAAVDLGAVQALIVHSSNPAARPAGSSVLASLAGPLVDNVPRLFGFLYERSQQTDRLSRSRLFVVSLAPPYRPDWPLLTDFRRATVEDMIAAAESGLRHRIGLVESWGPPWFQLSVTVPPSEAARGD